MNNLKPFLFLFIAAVFYTIGFPNIFSIQVPFLSIVGTSVLLHYIFQERSFKKQFVYYLYFNLIITIISFYWITQTLQDFGNLPFIVAAIMNSLYSFILNPQYWLLIFLLFYIRKKHKALEEKYFINGIFSILLAFFLTTTEYFIPQQFPVMLGQPWIIFGEHLGLASILGLPAFSFFSYLLAIELKRLKDFSKLNILFISLFAITNLILTSSKESDKYQDLNVRMVQANISNFLKIESENTFASSTSVIKKYRDLSVLPFKNKQKIDLIIWPETAYPYPLDTSKNNFKNTYVPAVFKSINYKMGAEIVFGGYDHFRNDPEFPYFKTDYNSAIHLDKNGIIKDIYHKHILIPFGETLPLGPLNKHISQYLPEVAFFMEGQNFPIQKLENEIKFISTICYEILRPEFIRKYLNNVDSTPDILINLTNDSWYGNTVEPEQHLFLSRWRAIEFNIPILRSTNTGITTYINSHGMEEDRLNYNTTANLDLTVRVSRDRKITIFQRFGFTIMLPILLLLFLFHILLLKLKND